LQKVVARHSFGSAQTRASTLCICQVERLLDQYIQQIIEIEYRIQPIAQAKKGDERMLKLFGVGTRGFLG
jgi:hypothetical protein